MRKNLFSPPPASPTRDGRNQLSRFREDGGSRGLQAPEYRLNGVAFRPGPYRTAPLLTAQFLIRAMLLILLAATCTMRSGYGSDKKKQLLGTAKTSPPEAALRAYVDRVRAQQAAEVRSPGSIWSPEGRLVRLGTDAKAVRVHDVVSIVVTESLAASTDGQVKNSRASNANSAITSLFGQLKASNAMQNLLGMNASSGLTAQGQSTTNSSLSTTFGGEVVDVMPNGILVVQATRQLTFSQQTQLIKLRGLVRPEDVSAQNQVMSTAMTDLELEVTGKGIVTDSTYRQNPIVRLLEKLLVF